MPEPTATIGEIDVWCGFSELAEIDKLIPNPNNPNEHSDEQVNRLAIIIKYQGWRSPIVVSNRSGFIVKGHCRLMAAQALQMLQVPIEYQDYESEAAEYSDLVADNVIAELATTNGLKMADILVKLDEQNFNLDLTGLDKPMIDNYVLGPTDESKYTKKIEAPIYEPSDNKPSIGELYNEDKRNSLQAEIEKADIPDDIKTFLHSAAERHVVFDFQQIADFYSHASKEVQELMENSALVIIDFDKAIENGYIQLTEGIKKQFLEDGNGK